MSVCQAAVEVITPTERVSFTVSEENIMKRQGAAAFFMTVTQSVAYLAGAT